METLIAHPNFAALRDELIARNPDFLQGSSVTAARFPDTWPNLKIHDVKETVEHRVVTYLADFSKPELVCENYFMIRGILDYYADKVRVIIPYFPVGTMERISEKGEIATAGYMADILSLLPPGRTHKTSLHTFDIHAPVERYLFDSFKVNTELHSTSQLLDLPKDTVIAFPDEGAAKRFGKEYAQYEQIICTKVRKGDERVISIKEGKPR